MLLEPVSSTAPRLSSTAKIDLVSRKSLTPVTLLCQAQGHPVPSFRLVERFMLLLLFLILEPVGAKAPTFATDLQTVAFTRRIHQSFGLLCQAQAYPVPSFRYNEFLNKVQFFFLLVCTSKININSTKLVKNYFIEIVVLTRTCWV